MTKLIEMLKKINNLSTKKDLLEEKIFRSSLPKMFILSFYISPIILILNILFLNFHSDFSDLKGIFIFEIIFFIYFLLNFIVIFFNTVILHNYILNDRLGYKKRIYEFCFLIGITIIFLYSTLLLPIIFKESILDVLLRSVSFQNGNIFIFFSSFFIVLYSLNFSYIFNILKLDKNYVSNLRLEKDNIIDELNILNLSKKEIKNNKLEIKLAADFVKSDKADVDDVSNLEKFMDELKEDFKESFKKENEIKNRKIKLTNDFDIFLEDELKNKIKIEISND